MRRQCDIVSKALEIRKKPFAGDGTWYDPVKVVLNCHCKLFHEYEFILILLGYLIANCNRNVILTCLNKTP